MKKPWLCAFGLVERGDLHRGTLVGQVGDLEVEEVLADGGRDDATLEADHRALVDLAVAAALAMHKLGDLAVRHVLDGKDDARPDGAARLVVDHAIRL